MSPWGRGVGCNHVRVVWFVGSTLAMVAWAAATRECTRDFSLSVALLFPGAGGMSEMSSCWELPMLLMTPSSGIVPPGGWDGCCGDMVADDQDGVVRIEGLGLTAKSVSPLRSGVDMK